MRKHWLLGIILIAFLSIGFYPGGLADQPNFPLIYIDEGCAGTHVGSLANPYDDFADINWTTGGDNSIFDYLAGSPSQSPTVYLNMDDEWRETLTVGCSGTATYPIIIGAYGSGADPIISGADSMSTFTAVTGGSSLLSDNFDDNDLTDWSSTGTKPTTTEASKYAGTHGVEVNNTGWSLLNVDWGATSQEIHISFWFNPKTIVASGTQEEYIVQIKENGGTGNVYDMYFRYVSGALSIKHRHYKSHGVHSGPYVTLTADTWVKIEGYFLSHPTAGIARFWVGGNLEDEETGIDTADAGGAAFDLDYIYFGKAGAGTWTTFNAYYDELVILDGMPAPTSHYEKSSVTTEPNLVFEDGAALTLGSAADALNAGEWFWGADTLTIRSTDNADPDTHTIEAGQRDYCIYGIGRDYITVDGIQSQYANLANRGIITIEEAAEATSTGWVIQNCKIKEGIGSGIFFQAGIGLLHDTLIDSNTIHDNGVSGIRAEWVDGTSGNENTISNNIIYNNPSIGIQCVANYWIIENNTVYGNGATSGAGINIQNFDAGGGFGENCIVRYNLVYDQLGSGNDGSGIILDYLSDGNEVYYNVVYGNWGSGIDIYSATNCNVYNNAVYGNVQGSPTGQRAEIRVIEDGTHECSNVVVKNNIAQATEATAYAIYVGSGAYDSSGLNITNNCWYAAATNWYYWNSGGGATLATWNALTGVGTDLNSDPLMTDPANDDFTLNPHSPCVNAGTDVGLTEDYLGLKIRHAPDIGAYENQTNAIFFPTDIGRMDVSFIGLRQ